MTKMFLHGRTDAIRPVTAESVNFIQTFWGENPAQQKIEALKKATMKHTAITKECSKAQGCDRHLYALFCVWQRALDEEGAEAASSNGMSDIGSFSSSLAGSPRQDSPLTDDERSLNGSNHGRSLPQQMPAIFVDGGWDRLNNTILSTSNCGNPSLRQFGFGPTSGDGFGIGYIIKEDSISICVSSKHRQTKRFVDTLEAYLLEIRKLIRQTNKHVVSPRTSRAREAEDRPKNLNARHRNKGRLIRGPEGTKSPDTLNDSKAESDDDGLGGCRLSPSCPPAPSSPAPAPPILSFSPIHVFHHGLPSPPTTPLLKAAIANSPPSSAAATRGILKNRDSPSKHHIYALH